MKSNDYYTLNVHFMFVNLINFKLLLHIFMKHTVILQFNYLISYLIYIKAYS